MVNSSLSPRAEHEERDHCGTVVQQRFTVDESCQFRRGATFVQRAHDCNGTRRANYSTKQKRNGHRPFVTERDFAPHASQEEGHDHSREGQDACLKHNFLEDVVVHIACRFIDKWQDYEDNYVRIHALSLPKCMVPEGMKTNKHFAVVVGVVWLLVEQYRQYKTNPDIAKI